MNIYIYIYIKTYTTFKTVCGISGEKTHRSMVKNKEPRNRLTQIAQLILTKYKNNSVE